MWREGEVEKSPLPVAINLMAIHEGVFFEATGRHGLVMRDCQTCSVYAGLPLQLPIYNYREA